MVWLRLTAISIKKPSTKTYGALITSHLRTPLSANGPLPINTPAAVDAAQPRPPAASRLSAAMRASAGASTHSMNNSSHPRATEMIQPPRRESHSRMSLES